jgi:preprotein translocase subunit SecG
MTTVILVIHLILAIALVAVVLLQRSEGGALGMGGGGGGGMGGFMTGRSTANLLTRTTAVLAALFIVTSLVLVKLSGTGGPAPSLLDDAPQPVQERPVEPSAPAAPLAR